MFKLTVVVGVLALIALALPDLVLLGLFLILPGIVLMVAPTAFIYLATATAIRSVLSNRMGAFAIPLSLVAAGVIGWIVAWPFQLKGEREYRDAIEDDVASAMPVELSGHVRLERYGIIWRREQQNACDELCAALLLVPGVKSVTVVNGDDPKEVMNWQLVSHGSVPDTGVSPTKPEDIFYHYPLESKHELRQASFHEDRQTRRQWLAAEWNLRLATRETLLSSEEIPAPDMTIVITQDRNRSRPHVQRVAVSNRSGETLLRRSLVKHAIVQTPLYIAFQASFSNSHFTIGRKQRSTGNRYEEFDAITELLLHVPGLRQLPSKDAPRQVKRALMTALADPDGNPKELALAVPWIGGLNAGKITAEDDAIARRVVGDLRIRDVGEALNRLYSKKAPLEYRSVLVQRILASETSAEDRQRFAKLLANMPAGTFADMTDQEWQILNDPGLRLDAAPFIERLADLGSRGVDPLVRTMQHAAMTIPHWHVRRPIIESVCRGLTELGTDASDALPIVQSLFEQKKSPLTNSAKDALNWRVAMARMGLDVTELPNPSSWREHHVEKMHAKVRRRLDGFEVTGDR
ncbi:hypothetical protein [Rhodopirellula sp. SWK7]|uniref:hypothetical protein n=1 Tax=Rhodopirellula sp. SWK7 TaxID=595460 RepID=UPI0002BFCC0D|nr:hypothetical protein [Rhodopirellula sp. SWK7]EMI40723.1 signal peptide protein [Rhodopirellula sp. SWK7]